MFFSASPFARVAFTLTPNRMSEEAFFESPGGLLVGRGRYAHELRKQVTARFRRERKRVVRRGKRRPISWV